MSCLYPSTDVKGDLQGKHSCSAKALAEQNVIDFYQDCGLIFCEEERSEILS